MAYLLCEQFARLVIVIRPTAQTPSLLHCTSQICYVERCARLVSVLTPGGCSFAVHHLQVGHMHVCADIVIHCCKSGCCTTNALASCCINIAQMYGQDQQTPRMHSVDTNPKALLLLHQEARIGGRLQCRLLHAWPIWAAPQCQVEKDLKSAKLPVLTSFLALSSSLSSSRFMSSGFFSA